MQVILSLAVAVKELLENSVDAGATIVGRFLFALITVALLSSLLTRVVRGVCLERHSIEGVRAGPRGSR